MIESISTLLRSKEFPPLIFFFGEEEFLLEEAYSMIFASLMKQGLSEFNVDIVDGEDVTADQIVSMAGAFPMMGDRRLLVVKHFDKAVGGRRSKAAEKSPLAAYLRNPSPSTVLILLNSPSASSNEELKGLSALGSKSKQADRAQAKFSKLKFPYKLLIEHAAWIEFPRMYDRMIITWMTKRFAGIGREIQPDAAEFILARAGNSLRDLANEIDKIVTYVGDKKKIVLDDILALVGDSREYNVFELQKAVGERAMPKALDILHHIMMAERAEILIVTTLTRYFLQLWKLIDVSRTASNPFEISKQTGINSFFITEYLGVLNRYSSTDIERSFFALRDADRRLKSSSDDSLIVLQQMLLRIMERQS